MIIKRVDHCLIMLRRANYLLLFNICSVAPFITLRTNWDSSSFYMNEKISVTFSSKIADPKLIHRKILQIPKWKILNIVFKWFIIIYTVLDFGHSHLPTIQINHCAYKNATSISNGDIYYSSMITSLSDVPFILHRAVGIVLDLLDRNYLVNISLKDFTIFDRNPFVFQVFAVQ